MNKKAVLILGMHRSGTSAVAGTLSRLGVDFGHNLMPATLDNEKGYFENMAVFKVNDAILASLGASWDSVLSLPSQWWRSDELDPFKRQIREIIHREFNAGGVFAVKDPRLSRLFPLWQEVLDGLSIEYQFIFPVRNPFEVALSLVKRNNFSVEKGGLLWMEYNLEAERHTRAYQRIIVSYDDFLDRPENFIQTLAGKLKISDSQHVRETMPAIREFLEPALRHHRVDAGSKDTRLPGFVYALHRLLVDLSFDAEGTPSSVNAIDEMAAEFTRMLRFFYPPDLTNVIALKRELEIAQQNPGKLLSRSRHTDDKLHLHSVKAWLSRMVKQSG